MRILAAWLHDIDPFAIQISGNFGLRWYGLAYLAAFVCGYLFARRIVAMGRTTLAKTEVMDFVITVAIGVVAGGRLGYVLFYQPSLLWHFTGDLPFWGVLMLNKGGMASHGGMIGVAAAVWLYARRNRAAKHSFMHLFDLTAISATTGFFFGRLANFINAELIGRACKPDLPWAVKFPQELFSLGDDKLAELSPVMEKVGVDAATWSQYLSDGDRGSVVRGLEKVIDAIQGGGTLGRSIGEVVAPLLTPHHPSQLYAALTEGVIVFVALTLIWLKPRKPGVIAGWFGLLYGVMRIFNEFFRTPDEHLKDLEFAATGITRGQWLSAGLTLVGIGMIAIASRRNAPVMGGLLK